MKNVFNEILVVNGYNTITFCRDPHEIIVISYFSLNYQTEWKIALKLLILIWLELQLKMMQFIINDKKCMKYSLNRWCSIDNSNKHDI